MTDFLDHIGAADQALADHLMTPGALRPGRPDAVDPVPVAIERPAAVAAAFPGQAGFVQAQPVAWLPLTVTVDSAAVTVLVSKHDELIAEGRRWRVAAAATRPGDGRWWRAPVEDLGPTA